MKDLNQILSSFGLLDSEIKTYLAALKQGASTAIELSEETKLSRQATYTAIQQLTDRGLMSTIQQGKKQYYSAEEPKKLIDYAQRKEKDIKDRISDLKSILPDLALQMGGEKPTVRYFQGKEGVRAIIDEMRSEPTREVYEIADLDAMSKVLTKEDLAPLKQTNIKKKKKVLGLYGGEYTPSGVDTTAIGLPKEYQGFNSTVIVYGDKIALITFEGNMHSIIVESKALATTMKILFNLSRKSLK